MTIILRLSNPQWYSFLLVLSIFSAVVSTEINQRNVRGRRTSILKSSLSSSRVAALPVAATTVTMNTVSVGVAKPPAASPVASGVKTATVVPGKAPAAAPVASLPLASTVKVAAVVPVKAPAVGAPPVPVSGPIKVTAAIPVSVGAPVKVTAASNVTAKAPVAGTAPIGITAPVKVAANVSTSVLAKSPIAAPVAIVKAAMPVAVSAPVKAAAPVKAVAPVKPVPGAVATKMTVAPIAAPVACPPVSTWSGTVRVDAGGADKDWTDPENQYQWKTDRYFDPKTSTTESIKPCGTLSPLLCTYRIGSEIHYDIPVPNPDSIYRIVLTIMEPTLNNPGQRPLDISSGPKMFYKGLDPHTACEGKQKSCTLQIKTGATDGKLDIKIVGTNPKNKAVLIGFLVQEVKK